MKPLKQYQAKSLRENKTKVARIILPDPDLKQLRSVKLYDALYAPRFTAEY
ncbi:MAG: hypothetical protein GX581_03410 [Syntrophomonadaceae bacterium]|jgi:hypothetical protein|nr:hypothetical protein [Syntrophomonadaceae bacterium]